ncbi:MAG: colanic acid/amylovoran biosynthesis glycosyltransferase, partial [Candidatus Omnitrophota bacterium]
FHGADISRHIRLYGKNVYKKLFESADLFMPVSLQMKKDLVELGCDPRKISIHHSGIELHKFGFDPEHDFAPEGIVRLLSVGRLVEKKGFFYCVQAVRQLVKEGCNLTYDIIGDGEEHIRLEAMINKYALGDIVSLRGAQSQLNVVKQLKSADIFLGPSVVAIDGNSEGIPNTLKEAMAVGLPVISTYHGSIEELITHGESGLLCAERNVAELVQAIKDIINEEDQRWHYQHNARLIVEDEFSATALNQRLVKLYQRIQSK